MQRSTKRRPTSSFDGATECVITKNNVNATLARPDFLPVSDYPDHWIVKTGELGSVVNKAGRVLFRVFV